MAMRPAHICGCGLRVASGQQCPCRRQAKARADKARPNARQRGYDGEWEAFRVAYLKDHPRCRAPGCTERATDVDHILSVRDRPDLRLARHNCRPFCHRHHSQRTARDQAFGRGRSQTFGREPWTVGGSKREIFQKQDFHPDARR